MIFMTNILLEQGSKTFITLLQYAIPLILVIVITVTITNIFMNMVRGKVKLRNFEIYILR